MRRYCNNLPVFLVWYGREKSPQKPEKSLAKSPTSVLQLLLVQDMEVNSEGYPDVSVCRYYPDHLSAITVVFCDPITSAGVRDCDISRIG
jgi:hypothetical protein